MVWYKGPRPVRVRFFKFYREPRVRSASATVSPISVMEDPKAATDAVAEVAARLDQLHGLLTEGLKNARGLACLGQMHVYVRGRGIIHPGTRTVRQSRGCQRASAKRTPPTPAHSNGHPLPIEV
eukprot:gene19602-biopygen10049